MMLYLPTSTATFASAAKSRLKSVIFSKCEAFIVRGTFAACAAASVNYHLTVRRLASIADVTSTAVLTTSDTGTKHYVDTEQANQCPTLIATTDFIYTCGFSFIFQNVIIGTFVTLLIAATFIALSPIRRPSLGDLPTGTPIDQDKKYEITA